MVITELPKEQQLPFVNWLSGQTRPGIEGEGDCAWKWDYERWLGYWKRGLKAPVSD